MTDVSRPAQVVPTRALVIANRLPFPLDDGWKQRAFHIAQGVAERMPTTLLTYDTDPEHTAATAAALGARARVVTVPVPRSYTPAKLLAGLLTPTPVHVWNQESASMREGMRHLLRQDPPTHCFFESTFVYPLASELPPECTKVIDCHNIDALTFRRYANTLPPGPRRWYAGQTARKLARFEALAFADADAVWLCSDNDAQIARELHPEGRYGVVPNGVDIARFRPIAGTMREPDRLVFFGRLDYYPNVDAIGYFLREIWPSLRQRHPGLQLDIMGAGSMGSLPADPGPGVNLLGRVEDIRPVLARAGAIIVPLRVGGGTRLKILEALSMACPVVSTTIGAEGLRLAHGEDLLLADDARTFGEATSLLLDDAQHGARLGRHGRATVTRLYQWSAVVASGLERLPQDAGATRT